MKLLTDEMIQVLRDAMDAYAEASNENSMRYADRLFATVYTILESAVNVEEKLNGKNNHV